MTLGNKHRNHTACHEKDDEYYTNNTNGPNIDDDKSGNYNDRDHGEGNDDDDDDDNHDANNEDNNSDDADGGPQYCTWAVTGPTSVFQAVYVCRTCCPTDDDYYCVCQACADRCHADHDGLEYIAAGLAYCDCHKTVHQCQILDESIVEAQRLGIAYPNAQSLNRLAGDVAHTRVAATAAATTTTAASSNCSISSVEASLFEQQRPLQGIEYTQVYQIPFLSESPTVSLLLKQQAMELIRHSRETFWMDSHSDITNQSFCELEIFAHRIWSQHVRTFDIKNSCGAEWWVQVKPVITSSSSVSPTVVDDNDNYIQSPDRIQDSMDASRMVASTMTSEAVDLHYDKDEALAESFGLGSFPLLSTVTYLTNSTRSPPTIVLSRTYEDSMDEGISKLLLCHPQRGKHLVFDGTLLHGAPAHLALRKLPPDHEETARMMTDEVDDNNDERPRITFLVNVWGRHKPAGVLHLPESIRVSLRNIASSSDDSPDSSRGLFSPLLLDTIPIERVEMNPGPKKPNVFHCLPCRIQLPFLTGREATSEYIGTIDDENYRDDEDSSSTTIVSMFPPPTYASDQILICFGPGMEAYVVENEDEDEGINELYV